MNCPFPGMDPYLEDYIWPDFHTSLAVVLRNYINKVLPPGIVVNIEATAILDTVLIPVKSYRPDVSLNDSGDSSMLLEEPVSGAGVLTPPSISMVHRVEAEVSQKTLQVKKTGSGELIAAIEILSPVNKRNPNLKDYRKKRAAYFEQGVHLLEIDLLREGTRPVKEADMPEGTYFIHLENAHEEMLFVWAMDLATQLPTISLPLLPGTPSITLDLQSIFKQTYEDAGYLRTLNYHIPLKPGLRREVDQEFFNTVKLPHTSA